MSNSCPSLVPPDTARFDEDGNFIGSCISTQTTLGFHFESLDERKDRSIVRETRPAAPISGRHDISVPFIRSRPASFCQAVTLALA